MYIVYALDAADYSLTFYIFAGTDLLLCAIILFIKIEDKKEHTAKKSVQLRELTW